MEKLIIVAAPSGAGKTTIVKHLMKQFPHIAFSISATTRSIRPKEKDGLDYYFLTPEKFKALIEADAFVEWEEVYENKFYGTLKSEIQRLWQVGKVIIFDVDVQGALNIKKQFADKAITIFIKPPSLSVLNKRLQLRKTETKESLQQRVDKAKYELQFADKFDFVIVNDQLEKAFLQADAIVTDFLN
jgi:guanylate kinase